MPQNKDTVQIDLRPHYTFAYYEQGGEFEFKSLLYYRRADKALHYKFKAPTEDCAGFDWGEDMECFASISDEDAKALERVFGIMIDAINAVKEPWMLCDGCGCDVICGKRRVYFDDPVCVPPFNSFTDIARHLIEVTKKWNQTYFDEIMKKIPEVAERLENYIAENKCRRN